MASTIQTTAKKVFTEYLRKNGHRKTLERYAVLDEIYTTTGHFDVDTLFVTMRKKNCPISRATVYNTIELLLNCKLIIRHQFGNSPAQYERAIDSSEHDHLICTKCGKVLEFSDMRLDVIKQNASADFNFEASSHSLYIYGICEDCKKTGPV